MVAYYFILNEMNKLQPNLITKRLLLRQLEITDVQAIFKIRSNEVVYKYIAKDTIKKLEEAEAFIHKTQKGIGNNAFNYWAITLKETKELIGTICLWNFSKDKLTAEVGYELLPDYHKKGIMSEALNKVIEFGFNTLKVTTIEAITHFENEASKSLLTKHQFKLEKGKIDKGFPNNIIFTLAK